MLKQFLHKARVGCALYFRGYLSAQAGRWCAVSTPVLVLLLLWALVPIKKALCAPETWVPSSFTATGSNNERFGAALACSDAAGSPAQSYIAVGAPHYSSGAGAVYIFNPNNTGSPLQVITSPAAADNKHFGAALAFINDSNGDGRKELAIGEPNESGANGVVYVYSSTGDPSVPFSLCGSQSGSAGFGGALLGPTYTGMGSSLVVIGAPESDSTFSSTVGLAGLACPMANSPSYQSTGAASSRWGHSLAETPMGAASDVLVGAPLASSLAGLVASVDSAGTATNRYSGGASNTYGFSVASHHNSTLFGFAAPAIDTVFVKRNASGTYSNWCSLSVPLADGSSESSRSLAHLNGMFATFLSLSSSPYAALASFRSEPTTGGSVALFGVQTPTTCEAIKQVNNCLFDSDQQQGFAIAGGDDCKVSVDGTSRSLMIVGAPQAGDGGRVDLYVEGTELGAPAACSTPTPSPSPTLTDTPIPPPTTTPIPTGTADEPQVRIAPGSGALPAAKVTRETATSVKITFPSITLAPNFYSRLARLLNISLKQALKLNVVLSYVATVTTSTSSTRLSNVAVKSLSNDEQLSAQSSSRRTVATIRSRRNSVTLNRLNPGRVYAVSYRVEFRVARPKAVFYTRTSRSASFKTGASAGATLGSP